MHGSDTSKRPPPVKWLISLFGLLLALALGFEVGTFVGSSKIDQPNKEQIPEDAAAKARYARAVAGKIPDPKADYAAYPSQYSIKCYYAQHHDSADLCAQWRAAIAAEKAAEWTKNGFWISLAAGVLSAIAIGCLLLSLRQTEQSLELARVNQKFAEDATKAAIDGVKETRASNDLALRALKADNQPDIRIEPLGPYLEAGAMSKAASRSQENPGQPVDIAIFCPIEIRNEGTRKVRVLAVRLAVMETYLPQLEAEEIFCVLEPKDSTIFVCHQRPLTKDRARAAYDPDARTPMGFLMASDMIRRTHIWSRRPAVYGFVRFQDALGLVREQHFAFQATHAENCDVFERWGGSEYNYEREILD